MSVYPALLFTLVLTVFGVFSSADAHAKDHPNLLLIMADDLGFSDIGAFGGEIRTPNIDRIAGEGVRLTNFYTAATCSPTRAMIMSGVDNHLAGVGNMKELLASNQVGQSGYEGYLNDRVVTIAELLKREGYATYVTGKWHLGGEIDQSPNARGFDRSFIQVAGASTHFGARLAVPHELLEGTPPVPDWREDGHAVLTLGDNFYSSDHIAEKMIEYIYEGPRKPFFGFLSFTAPHWPLQARPEYIARYEGRYDDGYDKIRAARFERQKELGIVSENRELPPRAPGVPAWESLSAQARNQSAKRMEIYAAMIQSMDANIGRVLSYLERQGELENTVVMFVSDNGAVNSYEQHPMLASVTRFYDNETSNLGKKNSFAAYGPAWGQVSNTPFSGYKMQGYEGGIHVPAIIRVPNTKRHGDIDATVLTATDVLPTFLEAAGGKIPEDKFKGRKILTPSGVSFFELAHVVGADQRAPERYIATEIAGVRAVRMGDWKLVGQAPPGERIPPQWKLFNLVDDPSEQVDRSSAESEILNQMVDLWANYQKKNGYIHASDFPLPPPKPQ
ncbi:MAG: arylsulfatase [Pseudomonadota bacterium]